MNVNEMIALAKQLSRLIDSLDNEQSEREIMQVFYVALDVARKLHGNDVVAMMERAFAENQ